MRLIYHNSTVFYGVEMDQQSLKVVARFLKDGACSEHSKLNKNPYGPCRLAREGSWINWDYRNFYGMHLQYFIAKFRSTLRQVDAAFVDC